MYVPAGYWLNVSAMQYYACAPGTYNMVPGTTSRDACLACPVNTYQPFFAISNLMYCTQCFANSGTLGLTGRFEYTQCVCDAGYARNVSATSVSCYTCPMDTFLDQSSLTCMGCPNGTTADANNTVEHDILRCKAPPGMYLRVSRTLAGSVELPTGQYDAALFVQYMQAAVGSDTAVVQVVSIESVNASSI
jgi:hypothetical protein